MIEVYPVGLLVEFIHGEGVTGKITGLMVEGDNEISYRVAWWNGRTRVNEWVYADELKASTGERLSIGFGQRLTNNVKEAFRAVKLTHGMCKGGHNPPNESNERPPAPGGSSVPCKPTPPDIVVIREGDTKAQNPRTSIQTPRGSENPALAASPQSIQESTGK